MSGAIIERVDIRRGRHSMLNWIQQPQVSEEDAADYGPIAYGMLQNAHVFKTFAEAGAWVDKHVDGILEFAIHPYPSRGDTWLR